MSSSSSAMMLEIEVDLLLMDCALSSPNDMDVSSGFARRRGLELGGVHVATRSADFCTHVNRGCFVRQRSSRRCILQRAYDGSQSSWLKIAFRTCRDGVTSVVYSLNMSSLVYFNPITSAIAVAHSKTQVASDISSGKWRENVNRTENIDSTKQLTQKR